jgi:hypothetical protein
LDLLQLLCCVLFFLSKVLKLVVDLLSSGLASSCGLLRLLSFALAVATVVRFAESVEWTVGLVVLLAEFCAAF